MEKLTFLDKLKSWKRWMIMLGAVLPLTVQMITTEIGWVWAISLTVVMLVAGVLGLSKEDAARLEHAAAVLISSISKQPIPAQLPETPAPPADA